MEEGFYGKDPSSLRVRTPLQEGQKDGVENGGDEVF
jgi:hypothetical protein